MRKAVGIKTIRERVEQYKRKREALLAKYDSEDDIYDSADGPEYDRVKKKLRTYQVLAERSKK